MEALNQRFTDHKKLTVSELTALIRQTLEGSFPSVVVEGELSNCRPSSTGHLYFTLKDAEAAIAGIMFRNRLGSLSFEPKDGMLLRVRGSLSVYAQRGTYSIVAEEMELAGTGELLAMLEERKHRFAAEGLFDESRKKRIPRFPKTIGIVSSPTGAAVRDILNILSRRSGGMRVIVLPAPVQGSEAAGIIARRIEQANFWKIADVLIVGRGGGSLEDLLSFSEEAVVRAVAASKIPVISAVGHEIDWALSDFAADLRAPTPSAAAELVSDDRENTAEKVRSISRTLFHTIQARMERIMLSVKPFSPEDLEYRFRSILQPTLVRFDDAKEALLQNLSDKVQEIKRRLELANMGLEASSPLKILERGYSVVTIADNGKRAGKLVRSNKDVKKGDRLIIRPLEGFIHAEVE
ncbi:MAG: exodeoxyribonuclease VII large subunit [Treponema sp.]|jgi:exodeoxyribonuclease VII large subunit|nr:exodeoxyribonuclease VII large subunit [Treponema sp.]